MPSSLGPCSRRQLLAGASGLTVALAGCTGTEESTSSSRRDHTTRQYESTTEYEPLFVRFENDDRFVYRNEDEATAAENGKAAVGSRSPLFVCSENDVAELWIDPALADGKTREFRDFLEATDFGSQSIVVLQWPIEDCYERHVMGVRALDDDFKTSFCRSLKAPTTPCETDRELMEAIILRIDRAYAERPLSSGGSESASCRGPIIVAKSSPGRTENASADAALNATVKMEGDE
ncbi:hypothetical protein BDK88_3205 [Natrinema hispanicum]|uniref:Uncharacterized protein n=1 Tax=Natrinema hispanicum TaxID=392421 RepID=A0A482YDC5_9EURY|nr:hypothetical protein [Natrinema hispanicum]RZV08238.1 hypothetical protein BDK88_3205 [Natrinema hispanicum]